MEANLKIVVIVFSMFCAGLALMTIFNPYAPANISCEASG